MKRSENHIKYMKEFPVEIGLKNDIKRAFKKNDPDWRDRWFGRNGKLNTLYWNITYASQRAWRGYDFIDRISFSGTFIDKTIITLKGMNKDKHGYPCDMEFDEWTEILEELIIKFEKLHIASDGLYDEKNADEFDYEICEKEALDMFVKYFGKLWD